jgi:hypothetical protein
MKQLALASFAALGLLAAAAPGQAQFIYTQPATSPFYRPPVSPYLNLALPGNPALNYFGLVQPQINTFNQIGLLQGQLYQQQALLGAGYGGYGTGYPGTGLLITGYGAGFQNHWGLFQNWRNRATVLGAGTFGGPGLNPGAGYFGAGNTALLGTTGIGAGTGFGRTPQAPGAAPGGTSTPKPPGTPR